MNRRVRQSLPQWRTIAAFVFAATQVAAGKPQAAKAEGPRLTLAAYLEQVKRDNLDVQGSLGAYSAAQDRVKDKDLAVTPQAFANATRISDAKQPMLSTSTYDRLDTTVLDVGVSQQTNFGLQGKLHYELDSYNVTGLQVQGLPPAAVKALPTTIYQGHPELELSQPLWGNGFGRTIKANQDATEAAYLASGYAAKYQARMDLVQAEMAYWRLAAARDLVSIGETALKNAKKIESLNAGRAKTRLADESDLLQSKAAVAARELELKSYIDDERAAERLFNQYRNVKEGTVSEELVDLGNAASFSVPQGKRAAHRDDTLAAEQQAKATAASMTLAVERDTPTLDVFGSYTLNSMHDELSKAMEQSATTAHPTEVIGLKLSVPLDADLIKTSRRGAIMNKAAAEQVYEQRKRDEDQAWEDLQRKWNDAKERYRLAQQIEKAQQTKLAHERERLSDGRTTTYQVLAFELDYSQAQLGRVRAELEALSLGAQFNLYAGDAP